MGFRRGELAVKLGLWSSQDPSQEISNSMATRRSPQGSGPKAGATNPQTPSLAYSDRLSQLEKDMAEIRGGTMKEVLEKLRRQSDEIEEINRRFYSLDCTGNTLEDLTGLHAFGPKYVYIGHKILMKQPHDCSY